MHALAPLLFIFVLFNSKQLKTDKLYRANIFSLVGISYFVLLQYTVYWYRVFPSTALTQYLPGLLFVLSTIGIALSPWNKRSHPLKTLLLCSLFAITLLVTFAFDNAIKERIAVVGGFFEHEMGLKPTPTKKPTFARKVIELSAIGIRFQAPQHWQQHQLPSGHTYFTHADALDKVLMEVRPNCLGDIKIDTPTYLFNILELFGAKEADVLSSHKCTMSGSVKTCLLKVEYPPSDPIKEKWHWLENPGERSGSITIDFVILEDEPALNSEIWEVISSLEILKTRAEPCRTPAAWL